MKNRSDLPMPAKLAQGRICFEQWRSKQKRRTRLPNHLWALATELAREFGINQTARTLRLGYNCLKKRIEAPVSDDMIQVNPHTQFMELLPNHVNSANECVIECENAKGNKIRIHLKSHDLPGLAKICTELWSAHQ